MKVLIVTPHVFAGGAEKAALNLAYQLNSINCNTSIATLSLDTSKLPSHLKRLNYILPERQLKPPRIDGISTALTSTLRMVHSLVKLLRSCSNEFDLLNAYNFPSYWATYFAKGDRPVVWTCSEVLGPYGQTKDVYDKSPYFRFAFKLAKVVDKLIVNKGVEMIVTCSKLNSQLVKRRYGRDPLIVHTGVDYDFFSRRPSDGSGNLQLNGTPLLLQVGSLIQRKNQILSIRALKILKRNLSSAKLVLVGEGPWKPILQREVKELHLENDVIFMGNVSEEELRYLYHICDINLFPVRDQTFGLVPFEALAAGKPSIVSKNCGAAEIMERENIGLVINPTVQDLVDAVTFALRHSEYVEDMVKKGQRYVRENLTWERYAREMYNIFRGVLNLG